MKSPILFVFFILITHLCIAQKNYKWVIDSQYMYLQDSATKHIAISNTIQERKVIIKNNKAYRIIYINGKAGIDNYAWVKSDSAMVIEPIPISSGYSLSQEVPKCWDFNNNHFYILNDMMISWDRLLGMDYGNGLVAKLSAAGLYNWGLPAEKRDVSFYTLYQPFAIDIPIFLYLHRKYGRSFSSEKDVAAMKCGIPFPKTKAEVFEEIRQTTFFDMLVDDKQQLYFFGIEQDTLKVWKYDENRVLKDFEDEWELLHSYKLSLKGYFSAICKNDIFYIISNEGNIFRLGKKAKKIGTIGKKLSEVILVDDKDSGNLGWLSKNILPNLDKYSIKYILESANKIILK